MSPGDLLLLKILAVVALVFANGFFVAAEFALVKLRDAQFEALILRGDRRARIGRRVLANLDRSLSAAQLGITLASLALGWIGEPVFAALLAPLMDWLGIESEAVRHTTSIIVGFTAITFLHITAGEQAPKWMAIQNPMPTALWVAWPLELFGKAMYPFIWVLNQSSLWMLRQVGIETAGEGEGAHSEEELRVLVAETSRHSGDSKLGRNVVLNALDLRRRVVRDVMRPRKEVVGLDTAASLAECLDIAEETRYSRFPLCEDGNLDRTLGVIHIKDLFALRSKAVTGADLAGIAKKIIYVPETARLERLLQLFLERKLHFAMVVDEYGATTGLVTLENVLEELVGQIQDEFDTEKSLVEKKGEHHWELSGALPLHELSDLVGDIVREEGVTTASGLVTRRLGGFPKLGDKLPLGHHELTVEEVDGVRVSRLKLTRRAFTGAETGQTGFFKKPE